ncbi:thioesterase domain-containing protein, partial [Streptomyces sp. NPDC096080]|uniref:thioesterase domain-containing protein n=1 Tax=Streptomyces sp. NPDC096080 TaxID=3156693 RepID=UPI003319BB7C
LLARRDPATARRATAAKLCGALLVELLIAEHDPDHAVSCSSMAARFGGAGQFDYTAANACLDAFAHYAPPGGGDATVRMSVGWDIWRGVGMAEHALRSDARHQRHLAVGITAGEGADVFDRALHLQLPSLLVNTTDLDAARTFYEGPPVAPEAVRDTPAQDPSAEVTEVLLDLLGVTAVDPDAPLYDLGADSLTLLELLDEVKRRFGTDIDLSRLSHRVSLAEILGHLGAAGETGQAADVEVWQRGRGQDVLCLVHPVGGDIQAYRPLVAALPDDLTVCLIADPALRDPDLPARSLTERAGHYLAAVRAAFPAPGHRLRLAGWSFGAWTALSMAAHAEAQGAPADTVHLIDPPPPHAGRRLAAYDEDQIDAVFARELSGNGGGLPESGRAYAERLARCCRANLAAMADHRLPRLAATPATVWLAARPVEEGLLAPDPTEPGAWDAHLAHLRGAHRLDADHYEIVAPPHVAEIADALAAPPPPAPPRPAGRP